METFAKMKHTSLFQNRKCFLTLVPDDETDGADDEEGEFEPTNGVEKRP